jgi:ParB-like chromosome segregation protein Spo0J
MLELSKIRIDGGTQPRQAINDTVIQEYSDAVLDGTHLPPVDIFFDGNNHWLADGFHRYFAYKKAGLNEIPALIHNGTQRDAIFFSVGANATHGLRRTKEDKIQAIRTVLDDVEYADASDNEIAKLVKLTRQTVQRLRKEMGIEDKSKVVKRGDQTFKQEPKKTEDKPAKPAKPAKTETPATVEVVIDDSKTAELATQVTELAEENETLRVQLAVKHMESSEEEKTSALDTINALRKQVKDLERELAAVTASRNDFQQKNAELMRQVNYLKKQLDKKAA